LNDSNGEAANVTASAPSIEKSSSGTRHLRHYSRSFPQFREEIIYGLPNLGAARKSLPFSSNETNEPVAFIDRDDKVIGRALHSVNEQSLGVRFHFTQHKIACNDLLPAIKIQ
jgi:hypothetical protein